MARRPFRILTFAALLAPLALLSCNKVEKEKPGSHGPSEPWIAAVGSDTVTLAEFQERYLVTPHLGMGVDAEEGYIHALVAEKELADWAMELQLDTLAGPARLADELAKETVVETLLEKEIKARTTISNDELTELYRRKTHELTLNAWSFPDSLSAALAMARHHAGIAFDSLAHPNGPHHIKYIHERTLNFNETAPEFEELAYTLTRGEIGGPIFSDGSYWLLQVTGSKVLKKPSREGFAEAAPSLNSTLRARKANSVKDAYIRSLMKGRKLDMDLPAFTWLVDYLLRVLPSAEEDSSNNQPPLVARTNPEFAPESVPDSSSIMLERQLVNLYGFPEKGWTTREVLARLAVSPRTLRTGGSRLDFARRLKKEILFQAEFATLYSEGVAQGLARDPVVRREATIWRKNVFAQLGLEKLGNMAGIAFDVKRPDQLTQAMMDSADAFMTSWLVNRADSLGFTFNSSLLAKIDPNQAPTMARKTHFPNRPAEPMPIGYRWGMLWAQKADSSK